LFNFNFALTRPFSEEKPSFCTLLPLINPMGKVGKTLSTKKVRQKYP
jgi:hypothetical protein